MAPTGTTFIEIQRHGAFDWMPIRRANINDPEGLTMHHRFESQVKAAKEYKHRLVTYFMANRSNVVENFTVLQECEPASPEFLLKRWHVYDTDGNTYATNGLHPLEVSNKQKDKNYTIEECTADGCWKCFDNYIKTPQKPIAEKGMILALSRDSYDSYLICVVVVKKQFCMDDYDIKNDWEKMIESGLLEKIDYHEIMVF